MARGGSGAKIAPIAAAKKGLGSGRKGLKRLPRTIRDGSSALNRPALRRLARRAGVKRIDVGIYEEGPLAMREWLKKIVMDSVTFTEHAKRATVTINDVLMALKRHGVTLYGFAMTERRRRLTRSIPRHVVAAAEARVNARMNVVTTPPRPLTRPHRSIPIQQQQQPTEAIVSPAVHLRLTSPRPAKRTATAVAKQTTRVVPAKPVNKISTPSAGASGSATARASTVTTTLSDIRVKDIQEALAAFRDYRSGTSDNRIATVLKYVNGHMRGRSKVECSGRELNVVLESLEQQEAVMLTEDDHAGMSNASASGERLVWFLS